MSVRYAWDGSKYPGGLLNVDQHIFMEQKGRCSNYLPLSDLAV